MRRDRMPTGHVLPSHCGHPVPIRHLLWAVQGPKPGHLHPQRELRCFNVLYHKDVCRRLCQPVSLGLRGIMKVLPLCIAGGSKPMEGRYGGGWYADMVFFSV